MREDGGEGKKYEEERERDEIECKEERLAARETRITGPGILRCHAYTQGQIRRAVEYVLQQEPRVSEEPAALVPPLISNRELGSESEKEASARALSGSRIPLCRLARR